MTAPVPELRRLLADGTLRYTTEEVAALAAALDAAAALAEHVIHLDNSGQLDGRSKLVRLAVAVIAARDAHLTEGTNDAV